MIDSDHLILYHNFAQRIVTFRIPSTTYQQKIRVANINWPLSSSIMIDTISLTKILPSGQIHPIPFTINTIDTPIIPTTVTNSTTQPESKSQLVLVTDVIETLTGTLIQISYMIKGVYWTAEYLSIINSGNIDMIILLQLSANIKSNESIKPTKLTLISDTVDLTYSVQPQLISSHNHIILGSIPLLLANRIYVYYLNDNLIYYGYRFTPKISLPSGLIRFYQHDSIINGLGPFINDTAFKGTKANSQAEIIVGPTDQINGVIDRDYVKIWNWSEKNAVVILRYEKKSNNLIYLDIDPVTETDEYIEWELNIPITKDKTSPFTLAIVRKPLKIDTWDG